MRRLPGRIAIVLSSLIGLGLVAYAVVYVVSERVGHRTYSYPTTSKPIVLPTDSGAIREGQRLSTIHGCLGCHGAQAQGTVLLDDPLLARIVAPSLTAAVRKYTDPELVTIIRYGVRPDGHSVAVMPSQTFTLLSDQDLGQIIAFLKSLPAAPGLVPSMSPGPLARIGVAFRKFKPIAELVADAPAPPQASGDQATFGRYLALTACAQCHGPALRGESHPGDVAPSLQVVAAYSPEDFGRLMRTGVAVGGRKLGLMGAWARDNLSQLTDAEIAALYSYLHALPASPSN